MYCSYFGIGDQFCDDDGTGKCRKGKCRKAKSSNGQNSLQPTRLSKHGMSALRSVIHKLSTRPCLCIRLSSPSDRQERFCQRRFQMLRKKGANIGTRRSCFYDKALFGIGMRIIGSYLQITIRPRADGKRGTRWPYAPLHYILSMEDSLQTIGEQLETLK